MAGEQWGDGIRGLFSKPPYRGLPWLFLLFVVVIGVLDPHGVVHTGRLRDPDDYMRLNQVVSWLQGQGWYDLSVPRLAEGQNTIIHWSRFVDLPIALVICVLQEGIPGLSLTHAALMASLIVPLGILSVFVVTVRLMVRGFVGRGRAWLSLPFLFFMPNVLFNFAMGRVDHHGWQLLIAAYGMAMLVPLLFIRGVYGMAAVGGCLFAVGLWIGTEVMPQLVLMTGLLGVGAAVRGGYAVRNVAIFHGILALVTTALIPMALPVSAWSDWAVSWFSPAYVLWAWLAFFPVGLFCFPSFQKMERHKRCALYGGLVIGVASLFVMMVPRIVKGPFADYTVFNATTALNSIIEAKPVWRELIPDAYNRLSLITSGIAAIHYVLPWLVVIGLTIAAARRTTSPRRRLLWYGLTVSIGFEWMLMLVAQVRIERFVNLYALVPLVWCLCCAARQMWPTWPLFHRWVGVGIILSCVTIVPVPMARLAAAQIGSEEKTVVDQCNLGPVTDFFKNSRSSQVIMTSMNEGPEILFFTPHKVMGALYNVAANDDVYNFFAARTEGQARSIAQQWRTNWVLICRHYPSMWKAKIGDGATLKVAHNGTLQFVSSREHPMLIERLVDGDIPAWLKPVEIAGNRDYLVFVVRSDF